MIAQIRLLDLFCRCLFLKEPIVEVSLAVVLSLLQKYEECDSLLTMYSVMKAEYWLIKLNTLPVWGSSFRI